MEVTWLLSGPVVLSVKTGRTWSLQPEASPTLYTEVTRLPGGGCGTQVVCRSRVNVCVLMFAPPPGMSAQSAHLLLGLLRTRCSRYCQEAIVLPAWAPVRAGGVQMTVSSPCPPAEVR